MKKSEVITKFYADILDAMKKRYRTVVECNGRVQYKIYVWEDGEIECLEGVQGDTCYLKPRSMETRELYYVCTVGGQYIDYWDFSDHSAPEDDAEREAEEQEIIEWLVGEYDNDGAEIELDNAIEEAERAEEYEAP